MAPFQVKSSAVAFHFPIVLLLALSSVAASDRLIAADALWPEFRGPTGDGIAQVTCVPTKWAPSDYTWSTAIPGKGWSSPVVAEGVVWMTTAIEQEATEEERLALLEKSGENPKAFDQRRTASRIVLLLVGVDLATGEITQRRELFGVENPDPIHAVNSYASPTPVVDGPRLYCHFGTFGTICVDRQTLEPIWQRQLPLVHAVGPGSSPVVHGDLLVLICDGVDRQYVTALDKLTGETVWETDRPSMDAPSGDEKKAYCTPVVVTDSQGREQLICMGSQWLVSYDPATGDEWWRLYHGTGFSVVPRPVVRDGIVYFSTGFGKPQLWSARIDGTGDVTETHVVWSETRNAPAKPSPLLIDDQLYMISDTGIATCLDPATGATLWRERIGGNYSASPLYAGGYIFLASHEGAVTVIKAGKEFEEVAKNEMGDQIMASPVALDRTLLIRTAAGLVRIDC